LLFRTLTSAGVAALLALSAPAFAQGDQPGAAALPGQPVSSDQPSPGSDSIQGSLGHLGDPLGLRGTLAENGVTYSLTYIGEVLGNVSGGERRGAVYGGRLDGQLDVDLGRAAGWSGATFHTSFFQIHGPGLSSRYLGNLLTVSSIEAVPATRLFELWLEQKLLEDKLSVRAGQLAADTEFVVSQYAALFVNSTFGWPGPACREPAEWRAGLSARDSGHPGEMDAGRDLVRDGRRLQRRTRWNARHRSPASGPGRA
jgi:porin